MKITRRGSRADFGEYSIEFNDLRLSWKSREELVEMRQYSIQDFTSGSKHDYVLQISLSEVAEIVKIIGDKVVNENADLVSNIFSSNLRELIRIQKACIGKIGDIKGDLE